MTKLKSLTIRDIARVSGVSPSTVSRVLNNSPLVTEDKRQAVMAAIEQLGYRPNVVAQGLARGKSTAIGVLTQDIASPFYGEILRGVEQGLRGSIYHPVFASGNWRLEEERDSLHLLLERRVDALIVLGGQLPDRELREIAAETPVVAVGRTIEGLEHHCLRVDDEQGAYRATRYLLELGHRQIAHIAGLASHQDVVDRRLGYQRALREMGVEPDVRLIVEGSFTEQSGMLAVETLLMRGLPFTAIFIANDQMAYGARLALFRRGIRVPEDMSLVGFDDLPSSAYTTPPLTTVRQPTTEMGIAAAQAAIRLIDGQEVALQPFGPELIVRESAALSRSRPAFFSDAA